MNNRKAIGILGGMGPEASVYMYNMLIQLAVKEFGAVNNDDFPEIVLHSIPVPDFISNNKEKQRALKMLEERVKQLNSMNLLSLGIACNTAHVLLPSLQQVSSVPFLSMIEEVVSAIPSHIETVGILGTPSTIRFSLYHHALEKKGKKPITPTDTQIKTLEAIIRNVIAGKLLRLDSQKLEKIALSLQKKGAQGIILGCTELPLVFPKKFKVPVYNSVVILARALLRNYYK